jgi:60 kDa SS-A/Ro ribonucleoprotein
MREVTDMANKNLFGSVFGRLIPPALRRNEAGGRGYARTPEDALAQYAATGCLNATFYASAETQLDSVLPLAARVPVEFVAKTAVYARERGFMKDMPALLAAVVAARDARLFDRIFDRVVDTPRMLRTFAQITRSGVTGRRSFGTAPRRAIRRWFEARSDDQVFAASVGNAPSLADVVKMVHPLPATATRAALYGYLVGRTSDAEALPPLVREFEAFKAGRRERVPDVPFQMLTALNLGAREWRVIAANASWQTTRMNLNTFARHGVFDDAEVTGVVANRLADRAAIARARAFPYQLLATHAAADRAVPRQVLGALEDAMEIATANVPAFEGRVIVCPDVSGSMRSPVTGTRKGATSAVRCVDVAALMAAAILRRNPDAEVLPFAVEVEHVRVNPRDTVMTNAARLAAVGGGGTCVSAPFVWLNGRQERGDLVIVVSDNESWADVPAGRGTATMEAWNVFRRRNPGARLVLLDIQPTPTTQVAGREDILNVGGFSDQVFSVVSDFAAGRMGASHWAGVIDAVEL